MKTEQAVLTDLFIVQDYGSLPRDFTIEINDFDLMCLERSDFKSMEKSWIDTRRELIRRGYEVIEWIDESRMVRCARCTNKKSASKSPSK